MQKYSILGNEMISSDMCIMRVSELLMYLNNKSREKNPLYRDPEKHYLKKRAFLVFSLYVPKHHAMHMIRKIEQRYQKRILFELDRYQNA